MLDHYNDMMTVADVCDALLIGRNRVYELLGTGAIKGFRIGKTWRIPRNAVEVYICQKCRIGYDKRASD